MRLLISACILLLVNGCSSQPPETSAVTSAIPVGANAQSESGESGDRALARAAQGYKIVKKNGQELYCRNETPVGSHMSKTVCLTQGQLKATILAEQETRDTLRAPRTNNCIGGPSCRN